jgi:hypothetical protein
MRRSLHEELDMCGGMDLWDRIETEWTLPFFRGWGEVSKLHVTHDGSAPSKFSISISVVSSASISRFAELLINFDREKISRATLQSHTNSANTTQKWHPWMSHSHLGWFPSDCPHVSRWFNPYQNIYSMGFYSVEDLTRRPSKVVMRCIQSHFIFWFCHFKFTKSHLTWILTNC